MNKEKELGQKINDKGLNAPRITPDHIDSVINEKSFHVFGGTCLTVCCLTLLNGFTVTGESACASPANFDKGIGEEIAFKNARDKIWALEGYLLKQMLFANRSFDDIRIAKACHDANKAYCESIGDDSQPEWVNAPEWQTESAIAGVLFHKDNPDAGADASHNSWMEQKQSDGWVYGEIKDPKAKTHPCIVPFDQLPVEQQAKDFIFKSIVNSLS